METTEGFYKLEDDNWLYAPNFVCAPDFTLEKELKDTYIYPVDGWYWYSESPLISTTQSNL
jgi:hypothetical protein